MSLRRRCISVTAFSVADPTLLLHGAIYSVLVDPGLKVPSPSAKAARETATALVVYCGNPQSPPEMFSAFAKKLTSSISCCFVSKQTIKLKKEAMWGHYHKLRSSDSVRSDWIKFVQESVGRTPSPVFYQHAIHEVFKCLIKCEYPVASDDETGCNKEITREEENVLRYVFSRQKFRTHTIFAESHTCI